jgi:hypothetical protein
MTTDAMCTAILNLATPSGSERVRDFQPPWRTVFLYTCPECRSVHRVRAGSFRGGRPEPGIGAILCGRVKETERCITVKEGNAHE